MTCKNTEKYEEEELFKCRVPENEKEIVTIMYGPDNGTQCTSKYLGRTWPMVSRFEFWLKTQDLWNETRSNSNMRKALRALKKLDKSATREKYWRTMNPIKNLKLTGKVMKAAKALDEAMLELEVLKKEYAPIQVLSCTRFKKDLKDFVSVEKPPRWGPMEDTGNFVPLPEGCIKELSTKRSTTNFITVKK